MRLDRRRRIRELHVEMTGDAGIADESKQIIDLYQCKDLFIGSLRVEVCSLFVTYINYRGQTHLNTINQPVRL